MTEHGARSDRGPQEGMSPPHFWQVPEAEAEIAVLGPTLRHLRVKVSRLNEVQEELERLAKLWGQEFDAPDHPDAARKKDLAAHLASLRKEVEGELRSWHDRGIEVKDLAMGLVDFYALRHGEIVFLCWRSGEDGVRFWHPLEGGFRTRRPLTPEERTGGLDSLPVRGRREPTAER